jgi:hypothetical protein
MMTYPEFLIRRLERRAEMTKLAAKIEARAGNCLMAADLEVLASLLEESSIALEAARQGQAMPLLLKASACSSDDSEGR